MNNATVKEIKLNRNTMQIEVLINAKDSLYIQEPKNGIGSTMLLNSAPLVEGFNYILEHHFEAVNAMKGNNDFMQLRKENKLLKADISHSQLADRIRQFLSALDYEKLSDFQAKCVLLIEKELQL